jgi:hypothetical protein
VFKRTFWFSTGAAVGLGSSVWAGRKVKRAAQRFMPEEVQREVTDRARRVGRDVRAAANEGRTAMREREAELRADVDNSTERRTRHDRSPATGPPTSP